MGHLDQISKTELKKKLSHIILGQKGGRNRIQIIEMIENRPYNVSQLSKQLNLNYRTVKHHIEILLENGFIESSKTGSYGEVFFLSPEFEENIHIFKDIIKKLLNFTSSPEFFKRVLKQTKEGVIIIDDLYEVFFWNQSATTILGYKEHEIIGEIIQLFPDLKLQKEIFKRSVDGRHVKAHPTKFQHRSGHPIDVSLTIDNILDEEEETIGFSLVFRDISEHIMAEENKQRLADIVESSDDAIFSKTLDGTFTSWNKGAERIYGYKAKEMVGQPVTKIVPNDRSDEVFNILEELRNGQRIDHFETQRVRKNGELIHISLTISPILDVDGNVIGASTIARDITERKMAEQELRESEEKYRIVADFTYDWEYWIDPEGHYRYVSPSVERITGYSPKEFLKDPGLLEKITHPDDREIITNHLQNDLKDGQACSFEFRIITRKGDTRWIGHVCQSVSGADGEWLGYRGSNREIIK